MAKLRSIINKFEGIRKKSITIMKRDELFITRDEIQFLFQLTSMQVYELLRLMDKSHQFRIPILDLWGALILMALDIGVEEKVEAIFALLDTTGHGWLSLADLKLLIVCTTRGLSHIKNIHVFTEYLVEKFVRMMLTFSELNEKGEISLKEVRTYMTMDENSRAYFAALGAETVVVDTGMLVKQRREVMQNIAEVDKGIKLIQFEEKLSEEDHQAYIKERGGDSYALRIAVAGVAEVEQDVEYVPIEDEWGEPTLEQRSRRLARAKARGKGEKPSIQDAVIFADPNARKKNQTRASAFDENSVTRKWNTLYSHTNDNLKQLDLDLVEDLFEYAGITLSDIVAEEYFAEVRSNPLNMRNLQGLLTWYRDRLTTAAPIRGEPPLWRRTALDWGGKVKSFYKELWGMSDVLNTQKSIIENIKKKQAYLDRIREEEEEVIRLQQEAEAEVKRLAEEKKQKKLAAKRNKGKGALAAKKEEPETANKRKKESKPKPKKKGGSADANVAGELKGSVRLAAWHRQQVVNTDVNRIQVRVNFGHPELVVEEKPPEEKAASNLKNLFKKKKGGALKEAKKVKKKSPYKTKIKFNVVVNVADNKRPEFFNEKTLVINNLNYEACDILNTFKKQNVDKEGQPAPESNFGTAAWIAITISKGVTTQDELILSTCVINFFECIPAEYRFGSYTSVRTKILYMPSENDDDDDSDAEMDPSLINNRQRIMLVVFLHEVDRFTELEENMPAGVLISRAIRNLAFQVELVPTITQLYQHSKAHEGFEERLFGPQEDELGDEGMNPLRFAKLQRQRLNAAKDAIAKADTMNVETLKEHLTSRGLSAEGGTKALIARVRKAFQRQADISGFGELSAFGSDMSARIFRDYWINKGGDGDPKLAKLEKKKETKSMRDKAKEEQEAIERAEREAREPKGITLWDFNDLIYRTGAETIYDWKEYKATMESLELLTDKNSNLMGEGLAAYHEHYGGLANDMLNLGIGSLDDIVKGECVALGVYDGEGVATLLSLMEPHSMLYRPLKYLLTFLTSITDMKHEADYDKVSEIFETGSTDGGLEFAQTLRCPGWLSSSIHKWSESLADGNEGLLVSLRQGVHETFGRYSRFDDVFVELVTKIDTGSTVASADQADEESIAEQSGVENSVGSANPSGAEKASVPEEASEVQVEAEKDKAARLAALREEEMKREEELFATRMNDMLPPRSDGMDYGVSTKQLKSAVTLLNRINEILSDFTSFPISREESEGLTLLREEIDEHIKESKRKIEMSKQLCCAHACAMYDAIRMFTEGFNSVGWGTKEFCTRGVMTGMDVTQFLPKGYGESCIPRQQKEEKLERAAARKNAAMAALERERARRNENSEENQERREKKAAALLLKREQEEKRLFVEAMDGLVQARFGGKSTADLAVIARMWEKLGSMTNSRYPDTIKACIHASNAACALRELYSVDHFKGKEAISRLDKASSLATLLLQEHSSYPRDSSKVLTKKQKEDMEEINQKLRVVIRRKSGQAGGSANEGDEEEESSEDDGDANAEESVDKFSKSNSKSTAFKGMGKTEEILLPDELVVPLFCIFQNYLSICREANNKFLLGKMERVKRIIKALYDVMLEYELMPMQEKNTMPPFGDVDILLCGEVKQELATTFEELLQLEEDELSQQDTDSEATRQEVADELQAAEETEAKKQVELTPDTIARYKRRGMSGYTGGAGGAMPNAAHLPPIEATAEENAEALLIREREAKKAKREKQRKLDGELRKQTVKQRNKLYHLINSGKITKIFANKAGHVLAEGQGIQWGDDADADEAEAFMEDSTQATSSDESSDDDEAKRKKKIAEKAKKKKKKEQQAHEEAERLEAHNKLEAEEKLKYDGSDKSTPSAGGGDVKEEEKPKSFFSFLFRNRDPGPPSP